MASVSCVLSEDQFLCSICLEVFTDPVTTSCGHSFCCICINKHWDNCDLCYCPMCKEKFSSRPTLKKNTCLSNMVSEFKTKPRLSEPPPSGAVLCDMCPDPKLQALQSCLVCQMSYCPLHLQLHLTVPRLQKHQLVATVTDLEERICGKHTRPLELLCRDHSELICDICSYTEHRGHSTVPLKEQCEEQLKHLQQQIQERRDKVQEIQSSVQISEDNAHREMTEGVQFFNDLMYCVQQSLKRFKLRIEQKHEEIQTEAEELISGLESEISALEQRRQEMEEMLTSDDHFEFFQTFTSVKPAPELQDWTQVSVRAPSYEGRVATAVSQLNTKLTPKMKELFTAELKQAKKHRVNVTLDPETAHPYLHLSQNNHQVQYKNQEQNFPDHPGRFSTFFYVLGKQMFFSEKFYFEVQVKDKTDWTVGVVRSGADRKVSSGGITPENGYWKVSGGSKRPLWSGVEKVGVFVDYDEGLMCFFDAETSALIDSITDCRFTENILPLFSPCRNDKGDNAAPLILSP